MVEGGVALLPNFKPNTSFSSELSSTCAVGAWAQGLPEFRWRELAQDFGSLWTTGYYWPKDQG